MLSCETLTYCTPSTPCANTDCPRHTVNAPTGVVGISTSDMWPTCAIKIKYKMRYPRYRMEVRLI